MDKGTKTIIWVGVYGAIAYLVYWSIKRMHVSPKEKDILAIATDRYKGFEDAFLKAWAEAKKSSIAEFVYNGKTYISSTGKAKI